MAPRRGWMVALVGPESNVTWTGTFGGVLVPRAVAGGLLGWAELRRLSGAPTRPCRSGGTRPGAGRAGATGWSWLRPIAPSCMHTATACLPRSAKPTRQCRTRGSGRGAGLAGSATTVRVWPPTGPGRVAERGRLRHRAVPDSASTRLGAVRLQRSTGRHGTRPRECRPAVLEPEPGPS